MLSLVCQANRRKAAIKDRIKQPYTASAFGNKRNKEMEKEELEEFDDELEDEEDDDEEDNEDEIEKEDSPV